MYSVFVFFFFFQAEDGIRDHCVTGVQTCALPILGRHWISQKGEERPLEVDDVLVVAPYNAQVAEIGRAVKARLGVEANVGTVDRFQGREAAVAIYSMTTSTPEDAPRDLEF